MATELSRTTGKSPGHVSHHGMLRRVLVIDDSEEFARLAGYFIRQGWPKANVEWHRPVSKGKPGAQFRWSEYDLLIIDHRLGLEGEDGLQWLGELRQQPDLPPALVLTDQGDEALAVRAIKLGAAGYMRKDSLSSKGLNAAIREILQADDGIAPAAQLSGGGFKDSREETGMTRAHLKRTLKAGGIKLPEERESPPGVDLSRLRVPGYKIISQVG